MKSYREFFAELKRRRVFKVTAVYGVVAFVLLQVADLLAQGLRLPDSFMPFITAVILLGFPLALILTWAFEITPEGVRKTEVAAPGELETIASQPASQRWPAGLLALLGIVLLLAGAWWAGRTSVPSLANSATDGRTDRGDAVQLAMTDLNDDTRPSIAVLPFVNLSADENQEYFSDGMTEEILNTLAQIDQLRVSGRTSAFAYKGKNVDLREIGRDLGVRYIIEGSVRKAGDQLRITAQLIDTRDGSHLWSDQYDRRLEDVFAIQTDIAESIAGALRVPLGLEGDESLVQPTGDLEAYDLYLAGRTRMRQRGESLQEAERLFEAAIVRDSSWAPAWAALAEAREISIWYRETFENDQMDSIVVHARLAGAERAARRALELDPRNASALVALASVLRDRGEWDDAAATYRRAISLDPDNAEAHQQYGEYFRDIGRIDQSVRSLDRAAALDPAVIRIHLVGLSLILDGRTDEAVDVFELGLARDPEISLPRIWDWAFAAYVDAGRFEDAREVARRLVDHYGLPPDVEATGIDSEGFVRAWTGALEAGGEGPVPEFLQPFLSPEQWMAAGQPDRALAMLAEGDVYRQMGVPGGGGLWHPAFDPLRSDPRFQALIEAAEVPLERPRRTPAGERARPLILRDARDAGPDAGEANP